MSSAVTLKKICWHRRRSHTLNHTLRLSLLIRPMKSSWISNRRSLFNYNSPRFRLKKAVKKTLRFVFFWRKVVHIFDHPSGIHSKKHITNWDLSWEFCCCCCCCLFKPPTAPLEFLTISTAQRWPPEMMPSSTFRQALVEALRLTNSKWFGRIKCDRVHYVTPTQAMPFLWVNHWTYICIGVI